MNGLMRNSSMMETFSGVNFDLLAPDPSIVCIEDIAHGLAGENRYNSTTRVYLSVAQHSILVADQFERRREKVFALLHDAHEAYCKDIPRPLKQLIHGYEDIAGQIQAAIEQALIPADLLEWFDHPDNGFSKEIKKADDAVCRAEAALLTRSGGREWGWNGTPVIDIDLQAWTPHQAETEFLIAWRALCL